VYSKSSYIKSPYNSLAMVVFPVPEPPTISPICHLSGYSILPVNISLECSSLTSKSYIILETLNVFFISLFFTMLKDCIDNPPLSILKMFLLIFLLYLLLSQSLHFLLNQQMRYLLHQVQFLFFLIHQNRSFPYQFRFLQVRT